MEVLLCFRVVGLLVVPFSTAENQPQRVFTPPSSPHRIDNDNDTPPHQAGGAEEDAGDAVCRVWLAPSTIPGAGLGLFAGTAFGEWEPIGTPDIVIPVVDYYHHNPGEQHDFIFDFYGWNVWRYGTIRYDTNNQNQQQVALWSLALPCLAFPFPSFRRAHSPRHHQPKKGNSQRSTHHQREDFTSC